MLEAARTRAPLLAMVTLAVRRLHAAPPLVGSSDVAPWERHSPAPPAPSDGPAGSCCSAHFTRGEGPRRPDLHEGLWRHRQARARARASAPSTCRHRCRSSCAASATAPRAGEARTSRSGWPTRGSGATAACLSWTESTSSCFGSRQRPGRRGPSASATLTSCPTTSSCMRPVARCTRPLPHGGRPRDASTLASASVARLVSLRTQGQLRHPGAQPRQARSRRRRQAPRPMAPSFHPVPGRPRDEGSLYTPRLWTGRFRWWTSSMLRPDSHSWTSPCSARRVVTRTVLAEGGGHRAGSGRAGRLRPKAPSCLGTAAPLGCRAERRPLGPREAALEPLRGAGHSAPDAAACVLSRHGLRPRGCGRAQSPRVVPGDRPAHRGAPKRVAWGSQTRGSQG